MKEKTLIIEDYNPANQKQTKFFLDQILLCEELDLTIRWKFYQRKIDRELLNEIADLICERGEHKEFSVLMIIETDQWKAVRKWRNVFNQYGFTVELSVSRSLKLKTVLWLQKKMLLEHVIVAESDYMTLREVSDPYWKAGLSVIVRNCNLSVRQYIDWFDEWVQTCDGGWIDLFMDAAGYWYTGFHINDCCHDSCLGKYLYLDAQGNRYFCAEKKRESLMDREQNDEIYDDYYKKVLAGAIEKRRHCTNNCEGFAFCQGGCPLSEDSSAQCKEYIEKLDYIRKYILKNKDTMFLETPNPGLRQMFLNVAAYGFRMESKT